jgi:hypothetical protein
MEIDEHRLLPKNDENTSILKICIDFLTAEFAGVCFGLEVKTGEKYYFHWDLPRLAHIMKRDPDKALFNEATARLYVDAVQGRIRVTRKA